MKSTHSAGMLQHIYMYTCLQLQYSYLLCINSTFRKFQYVFLHTCMHSSYVNAVVFYCQSFRELSQWLSHFCSKHIISHDVAISFGVKGLKELYLNSLWSCEFGLALLLCTHACVCVVNHSKNGAFFIGGLYSGSQNSTLPNVYWLNNFNNILRSYGQKISYLLLYAYIRELCMQCS